MPHHDTRPRLRPGSRAQRCPVCHQSFGGTTSGDLHRVLTGTHDLHRTPEGRTVRLAPGTQPAKGSRVLSVANQIRRCLDASELEAGGLHLNSRGVWVQERPSFAGGLAVYAPAGVGA